MAEGSEQSSGSGAEWSFGGVSGDSVPDLTASWRRRRLPQAGQRFGPYEVVALLGRGGMGAVFRARDAAASRDVALKVILDEVDEQRRERFRREGEVTARLTHPGVVRVHTAGESDGLLYLCYELVEGARPLTAAFAERDLPARVGLVRDAALALAHAHAQGVVHRDVKPDNLLVDALGRVRVADFGLAAARDLSRLTQTGAFVGTPTHMAPEQFLATRSGPPGPPADVWSLGVILYQALTCALPFEGATLLELGAQIVEAQPVAPRRRAPGVSPALEAVCLAALAKEPELRYPDAGAFAEDLERALAGEAPSAPSASRAGPLTLRLRRRLGPLLAPLAVTGALALGLAAIAAAWSFAVDPAADRRLRLRDLEQATLQAIATPGAVEREAEEHERLRRQLAALRAAAHDAADAADGRALAAAERRLTYLAGLTALAAGDDAAAANAERLLASDEGHPLPLHAALAAARAAAAIDEAGTADPVAAEQLAAALTRGIDAGLRSAELRAARARCVLSVARGGGGAPAVGLTDLAATERARPLRPAERRIRVRLHLLAGELPAARAALEALPDAPPELTLAAELAEAERLLDDRRPQAALHEVQTFLEQHPDLPVTHPRRRLAARCRREVAQRLPRGATVDPHPLVALLALSRCLDPEALLSAELLGPLVDVCLTSRNRDYALAADVAALAPGDLEVQAALAQQLTGLEDEQPLRLLWPTLQRTLQLVAGDPREPGFRVLEVLVLQRQGRLDEALAKGEALLPTLADRHRQAVILLACSEVRERRGEALAALAALDAAMERLRLIEPKLHLRRANLLVRLGRHEEALPHALPYALEGTPEASKYEAAHALVWTLCRRLGRTAEALRTTAELLRHRPHLGGWWVRRAWLLLQTNDASAAAAALREGAAALERDPLPAARAEATAAQEAADALTTGDEAAARAAVADGLERLEVLRGEGFTP